MKHFIQLHNKAIEVVTNYKKAEIDLIEILQQADEHKIYLHFKCKNLHDYTIDVLKLSESVAFNFIVVARKAKEVPELKQALASGKLSVSKARKITPVLTKANQQNWLKMAIELPQKKLEHEVAKANPKTATTERTKYVSENRLNLQMGISEKLNQMFKRAQDLESQKKNKPVTLEETLEVLLQQYLETQDPVIKSEKVKFRKNLAVARQVQLRDQGQCTHRHPTGQRCHEKRWLHVHHIVPRRRGGLDTLENLATLCSGHHRLIHQHI